MFSRRRFLAGGAAAIVPLVTAHQPSAWSSGPASARAQSDASPVAEPSPASVTPTPATGPETIGQLQVIRDARPGYDGQPVAGGQLNLVLPGGNNGDFSPVAFRQDVQIMVSYLDPLVRIDEVTMEPQPWLAESWEIGDDGTTITYKIRDDVRWHDGDRLQAKDVTFSLIVYRDDVDSAVRNFFTNMASVETVDRTTVKVTLTSPDANWLLNASSQLIFQRKQYVDYWTARPDGQRTLTGFNWKKNAPVGTGPWQIDEYDENGIQFARNERYWAGAPWFDRLAMTWSADAGQRLSQWKAGQADLLWPVSAADVQAASDTPGRLYVADSASVMFAAFNFDNPERDPPDFLSDVRIRRALSLAIDRDRYASEVFGGFIHTEKAGTVAQPWAHDETLLNPPRDVAAARQLLVEAGVLPPDAGTPVATPETAFELSVIVRNDSRPELLAVLSSIVDDLAEVGVGLRVRVVSPERFFTIWTEERSYDLIAYAYSLFPGFTDFDLYGSDWDIRQNPQGWNPGGYHNDDVDKAIRDFLNTRSQNVARDALIRLQQAANDDLFGLWFGFPQEVILVRPDIQGFQPNIYWETWDTRKLWRTSAPI